MKLSPALLLRFKIKRKEKSYEPFILNSLSKINSEELFFRVINKRIVSPV